MEDTRDHPEQVQLLSVVQTNPLHGHAHPVKVALVVQQRVFQSADFKMLQNKGQNQSRSKRHTIKIKS